jgi:hypothetical protein
VTRLDFCREGSPNNPPERIPDKTSSNVEVDLAARLTNAKLWGALVALTAIAVYARTESLF